MVNHRCESVRPVGSHFAAGAPADKVGTQQRLRCNHHRDQLRTRRASGRTASQYRLRRLSTWGRAHVVSTGHYRERSLAPGQAIVLALVPRAGDQSRRAQNGRYRMDTVETTISRFNASGPRAPERLRRGSVGVMSITGFFSHFSPSTAHSAKKPHHPR